MYVHTKLVPTLQLFLELSKHFIMLLGSGSKAITCPYNEVSTALSGQTGSNMPLKDAIGGV